MSEEPASNDREIPQAVVRHGPRWPSWLIWLVPIAALGFGGWLALRALSEHGPTVTINFKTAEGIEARKTKIRYKSVEVGEVKSIAIAEDRTGVVVTAQLTRAAADLLVQDTSFWVVRPRITGASVTGLGTLLAGSYIGMDVGKSKDRRRDFVGLEQPAIVTSDVPGKVFLLRGPDLGSVDVGSPIYFRHIQVGQVAAYELDPDGKGVTIKVFVNSPYDRHVTANTRFWHAEGIDIQLDGSGLKVNTQSVVSILIGGLAFEQLPNAPDAPAAAANTAFQLFNDRAVALKPPEVGEMFTLVFKETVRNLAIGAPVDFRGVVIGEVKSIDIEYDPAARFITVPVQVLINTQRLRNRRAGSPPPRLDNKGFVDRIVERGFRAQTRTASLVTGQMYIALDFFPDAPKATVDWTRQPPVLPTMPGSLQELQVTLGNIAKKLEKVPFDEIGKDLRTTLQSANKLISELEKDTAPELKATLAEARKTLEDARRAIQGIEQMTSPDAPLQQGLSGTLSEVTRAAEAFRVLSDYLERHPESLIRGKKKDEP
jgi:paraquat-inducible protein B